MHYFTYMFLAIFFTSVEFLMAYALFYINTESSLLYILLLLFQILIVIMMRKQI